MADAGTGDAAAAAATPATATTPAAVSTPAAATIPTTAVTRTFVGAMSGTSADGIDVAVIKLTTPAPHCGAATGRDGRCAGWDGDVTCELVHYGLTPYDGDLRRDIFALRQRDAPLTWATVASLGVRIADAYADAVAATVRAAGVDLRDVAAMGVHGQTMYHAPPLTVQVLDAPRLAARLAVVDVVSDFRRADCYAGGQGAPLVPFADWLLFRRRADGAGRILLNLGGIANVTGLPPCAAGASVATTQAATVAFDTGPANCVSDHLMRSRGGAPCDAGGVLASAGKVLPHLLAALLDDPYFTTPPPKSTDTPYFIAAFEAATGSAAAAASLPDLLATAVEWTAASVARGMAAAVGGAVVGTRWEVLASGGGTHNATLMTALARNLATMLPTATLAALPASVGSAGAGAIPSDAKEAVAFALLAAACVDRVPANLPSCTGATAPVIGGVITPAPVPGARAPT